MKNKVFIVVLAFIQVSLAHAKTDCTQVTQIPQIECEALLDFYSSTNGYNWKNDLNYVRTSCLWPHSCWNTTEPCSWYGVSCSGGHVTSLYLIDKNLTGSLPNSLGNLSELEYLYLMGNQFSGSIPKSLGNLSNLEVLLLSHNQLSGYLPESLGNLSNLIWFHLGDNELSKSIPKVIGKFK